jgi:hypothetical protein
MSRGSHPRYGPMKLSALEGRGRAAQGKFSLIRRGASETPSPPLGRIYHLVHRPGMLSPAHFQQSSGLTFASSSLT